MYFQLVGGESPHFYYVRKRIDRQSVTHQRESLESSESKELLVELSTIMNKLPSDTIKVIGIY